MGHSGLESAREQTSGIWSASLSPLALGSAVLMTSSSSMSSSPGMWSAAAAWFSIISLDEPKLSTRNFKHLLAGVSAKVMMSRDKDSWRRRIEQLSRWFASWRSLKAWRKRNYNQEQRTYPGMDPNSMKEWHTQEHSRRNTEELLTLNINIWWVSSVNVESPVALISASWETVNVSHPNCCSLRSPWMSACIISAKSGSASHLLSSHFFWAAVLSSVMSISFERYALIIALSCNALSSSNYKRNNRSENVPEYEFRNL